MKNIEDLVLRIKEVEDKFVKYNLPQNTPKLEEQYYSFLKRRFLTYNGYDVVIKFNRHDFNSYYEETLQILSYNNSFLPFDVVKNLAQKFLGNHCLLHTEIINNNKKIYIWLVCLDKNGKPFEQENQKYIEEIEYEDIKYKYILPHTVTRI